MSGSRAKAKRKSAKKAAADSKPAPALGCARLEEFIIGNVRCFADIQRVPIRPITLLVGENSAGKTTFLGCYQKFVDMLAMPPIGAVQGAFSRPPFDMGEFRNIARNAGNGKRKPRGFYVGGAIAPPSGNASPISLEYFFRESGWEAVASCLLVNFPDGDALAIEEKFVGKSEADGFMMTLRAVEHGAPTLFCELRMPNIELRGLDYNRIVTLITLSDLSKGKNSTGDFRGMRNFLRKKFPRDGKFPAAFQGLSRYDNMHMSLGECVAVSPIRPIPHRSYEPVINGDAEARFLVEMSRMSRVKPKKWNQLRRRLIEFGIRSEMFSDLKLESHGKGIDAPFSLRVSARNADANIADVGYGVSQLMPFLGRIINASLEKQRKHFLFQQPEDHLHPRAQAEFASFIAESAKKNGHTFLVETHSDFIVDRVRICVAKGLIDPEDVALLYFEPQKSGGKVKIHRIEMNNNGEPARTPPKGYREFFLHETERVLGFRD